MYVINLYVQYIQEIMCIVCSVYKYSVQYLYIIATCSSSAPLHIVQLQYLVITQYVLYKKYVHKQTVFAQ